MDALKISPHRTGGFSLTELLIAMAVGLIVLTAAYKFFTSQDKAYKVQTQIEQLQQSVRVTMETMVREIRMAGCDPLGVGFDVSVSPQIPIGIVTADVNTLRFTQDFTRTIPGPNYDHDGLVQGPNEDITYTFDQQNLSIVRRARTRTSSNTASALTDSVLATDVQSLVFSYYDAFNNILTTPVGVPGNIQKIEIIIIGRTSQPDNDYSANGGYRTYRLASQATPRNI